MMIDLLYPEDCEKNIKFLISPSAVSNLEIEYIASLICPYNTAYALKILSEFTADINVIHYRQGILRDFIDVPQLEGMLYNSLHTIYNNSKSVFAKAGSTQSFFEISENIEHIDSYIDCINSCHTFYEKHFSKLKSAGMKRVVKELENKYSSEEFHTLISEITELKEVMAGGIKSVTFGVNLDNLMHPSEIALLSVSKEPFREKKLFEKLFSKEQRAEPISNIYCRKSKEGSVVAINQKLFSEIDALSGEYTKHFNTALRAYYSSSVNFLLQIEPQINFYVGVINMMRRFAKMNLPVSIPEILPKEDRIYHCHEMYDMVFASKMYSRFSTEYNSAPLISTNDCKMDEKAEILILTGPNNGGKTTYTRAAGINQVMGQCGLFIAGKTAQISIVNELFVHFPKEEEIGINTSRFTEECKEFKATTERATEYSMILMNESLSSTTPTECLLIAEELMKIFSHIGVRLIFTTHIRELVEKIPQINSVNPQSLLGSITALCDKEGKPLYKIVEGFDDSYKNARYIFERFGISYEEYLKNKKNFDDLNQ